MSCWTFSMITSAVGDARRPARLFLTSIIWIQSRHAALFTERNKKAVFSGAHNVFIQHYEREYFVDPFQKRISKWNRGALLWLDLKRSPLLSARSVIGHHQLSLLPVCTFIFLHIYVVSDQMWVVTTIPGLKMSDHNSPLCHFVFSSSGYVDIVATTGEREASAA